MIKKQQIITVSVLSIAWLIAGLSIGTAISKTKCIQVIEKDDLRAVGRASFQRGWYSGAIAYKRAGNYGIFKLYERVDSLNFSLELDTTFKK